MGHVQSKWRPLGRHVNFAWDLLHLYFDKYQKNEIRLL